MGGEHKSIARIRRSSREWKSLVTRVDSVVRGMPLWKLQRVGDQVLDFLYAHDEGAKDITLRPGVAYCLRAFYNLITDMVRGAWARHIRRINGPTLGDAADLHGFLFGSERSDLGVFKPILMDLQHGECFYCSRRLRDAVEVDHFIPWSRYPVDLGHNFVLAHKSCNNHKSDHIAAEIHLENWVERNHLCGAELAG